MNTLKISREEFMKISPFPLEEVPWEKNGFYYSGDKAGADPYYFAGLYYPQEPSAMCIGEYLNEFPFGKDTRVLDLCAAPGGKCTQIASYMNGKGILIANETEYPRAKILSENVERAGVKNCAVISADPETLSARFNGYFDLVLADAPCSGEGMFKKEENAAREWSAENVGRCALRQKVILDCAADMLCEGGKLIYSTCTFAEEEDEFRIESFLKDHPDFTLLNMKKIYPHTDRGEGHFSALLQKESGVRGKSVPFPVRGDRKAVNAFYGFAADFFRTPPEGEITVLYDGRMYLLPPALPLLPGRTLRAGVELGEYDGRIFKPAHALAMSMKKEEFTRFASFSREESCRYLHGEELNTELAKGWCGVGVGDFPLGLGKSAGGVLKNHLPKGLRRAKAAL